MKKPYIIFFLVTLVGINFLLLFYFLKKGIPSTISSNSTKIDLADECKNRKIKWNKEEYEIPSNLREKKFVLRIEDKNIDAASFNFKPLSGVDVGKEFTHCQASISKIPFYENLPENLKKEHKNSKGVYVSVGTKDSTYTHIVAFTLNIQVYVKRKSNENYDFDKALKTMANNYEVSKENNTIRVKLKGQENIDTSEFGFFIVEYEGKNMLGKDLELISEDDGKTWKVEPVQS